MNKNDSDLLTIMLPTSKGFFYRKPTSANPEIRDKGSCPLSHPTPPNRPGRSQCRPATRLITAPARPDADVDFVFGQVEINKPVIYYDGLCGNISSGVGTYAIEEGLVKAVEPVTKVRVFSRNTNQVYIAEVQVRDGMPVVEGDYEIAGVPAPARRSISTLGHVGSPRAGCCPRATRWNGSDREIRARWSSPCWTCEPCIFVRASTWG